MTMTPRRFYNPQFDLFLPNIVDLRFRDQKDTMERPFFSLSKSKRMKPIEYVNENDWHKVAENGRVLKLDRLSKNPVSH